MRFVVASAALAAFATAALAADLPNRPVVPVAAPAFTWTGFYAGLNAGYAFGDHDRVVNRLEFTTPQGVPLTPPPIFITLNNLRPASPAGITGVTRDGFEGGVQVGYNHQLQPGGGLVVGVEADIQYADMARPGRSKVLDFTGVTATGVFLFVQNQGIRPSGLDYFGTVRARAGYAFDRLLLFATGGLAYGNTDRSGGGTILANTAFPVVPLSQSGRERVNAGYALGVGAEYAFTDRLSAKLEGLYVDIRRNNTNELEVFALNPVGGGGPPASPLANFSKDRIAFGVLRTGLNYHF